MLVGRRIDDGPGGAAHGLFRAIGDFLYDQRLEPTPVNYAFAHQVLRDPAGPLARAVATLTDGGFRLSSADVQALGEQVEPGAIDDRREDGAVAPAGTEAAALVAATQRQVAGFESIMHAFRTETHAFGRDLEASEHALRRTGDRPSGADAAIAELARITAQMRQRVDVAEARLEEATHEASELRRQLAAAQGDARRDTLTGLPNRRAFEEALAACEPGQCHIAICDVDHFKSINDRYGHPVGDRVLKAIAATLERECAGHMVARYGGEEFTLLLTGIDADAACALIEDARIAVSARRYRLRETDQLIEGVSMSAGIVTLRGGEGVAEALQRADQYLYAAKDGGRNRTVGEFCR